MDPQLTIALAGNPNSGKTTAFNALTGSHQHVGNYPGITVEKKEGFIKMPSGRCVRFIDLPGTYSLTAYTQEETVARHVLAQERPDVVIDVLNAGALERNLYLTIQLLELGVPVVLALNMMDEAAKQGMTIDIERLSQRLGFPVMATVARTGEGLPELLKAASRGSRCISRMGPILIPCCGIWKPPLPRPGCWLRNIRRGGWRSSCWSRMRKSSPAAAPKPRSLPPIWSGRWMRWRGICGIR